ncbi:MAG: DNA internalization-related competence protein ComEC/Rec2 [Gammaproteobacteria bacterium]|nr:DNA internalization-related competence protein ComEC/Rec2 [Gammaproteobacteria bacterium]
MTRACLLVIAGGFAAQHSRVPVTWDLCIAGLVASLLLLAHARTRPAGLVLLGYCLFLQAGLAIIDERLDQRFAGDSLLTLVRIVDFPGVRGDSLMLRVSPVDDRRLPPLSRVSWFEPPVLPAIGETWELELRLKRPRGSSNPGLFDYEAWLFRERIHATGYVVPGKRNRLISAANVRPIEGVRRRFVDSAEAATSSRDAAAVLAAIGVGARHKVSRQQWQRYAVSGTSHLVAISGLHIGLAATTAFLLASIVLGLLQVFRNSYFAALTCSVLAAGAYAAVSGFGVPAQRASVMLLAAVVAIVRRRQVGPVQVLAAAALLIFLLDPVATMTPGFHLSFMAVVLLLWLARRRHAKRKTLPGRAWMAVRQLVIMQSHLLFGLMPLTVLIFQRIAFLSMPANLVAVPLFSTITVPLTLAALALGSVSEHAAQTLLRVAAATIVEVDSVVEAMRQLPLADIRIPALDASAWPVVVMPALWALLPRGWPGRGLALIAVVALVLHSPKPPPRGCADLHVLDVGQGLAVVTRTPSRTLVFDTGIAYQSGGSAAEQVVLPFLESKGISRIDWLIISHDDIDHSGGFETLAAGIDTGKVLAGESLAGAEACRAGLEWIVDDVRFRILHPGSAAGASGNDASCVLLVSTGAHSILLTGDIEADAERELLERGLPGAVDVVVVPHHGSATSSSASFVDATSPQVAVVSAGYGNRWGFPSEAVVERWQSVGAELIDTATAGAVSLRLCARGGVTGLRRDRQTRRRFWREGVG